jgi:hypothetical protein
MEIFYKHCWFTFIIAFLIYIPSITHGQYCSGIRFTETPVFTESEIDSSMNIVYSTAHDWQGNNDDLKLNVYYPSIRLDSLAKRPIIVELHGGSFLTGTKDELNFESKEFAKRGFVAATIDYRLGWNYLPDCAGDTVSLSMAIYRAMQDCSAALRYFVSFAQLYRLDTAYIFIGGESAGAFATVDLAFINQQEINIRFPWCQPLLGNLDASGNTYTNTFTLKGLFHNWGSIINIKYIQPENKLPMVGFAGALDTISPIDSGYYENCQNFPLMWGTRAIFNKLVSYGECADLTVKEDGGHGVYNNTNEQKLFRVGRACCFFKSLFCNNCVTFYSTDSIPASCSDPGIRESINDLAKQVAVCIYPDPATTTVTICANNHELYGSEFYITNALGQVVSRMKFSGSNITLDVSGLINGIYFVRFINGDIVKLLINYL